MCVLQRNVLGRGVRVLYIHILETSQQVLRVVFRFLRRGIVEFLRYPHWPVPRFDLSQTRTAKIPRI
jgi:hypothetical protein